MENCLLGLESKRLSLDGEMHWSLSELKDVTLERLIFTGRAQKYVQNSEQLLNWCLQCEERSQRRWFATKRRGLFLMPLNGSLLFLSSYLAPSNANGGAWLSKVQPSDLRHLFTAWKRLNAGRAERENIAPLPSAHFHSPAKRFAPVSNRSVPSKPGLLRWIWKNYMSQ